MSGGQEGIVNAFRTLGIEKRPYVVIYDKTEKNEKLLLEGEVDFLIDQMDLNKDTGRREFWQICYGMK